MVNLTRIYTRTGDAGNTRLSDNAEVPKTDLRVEAYGAIDETNSNLALAVAHGGLPERVVEMLALIRNELFDVGRLKGSLEMKMFPLKELTRTKTRGITHTRTRTISRPNRTFWPVLRRAAFSRAASDVFVWTAALMRRPPWNEWRAAG